MFSNTYNIKKETRAAQRIVREAAFVSEGIVFGGSVRDTLRKDFMNIEFYNDVENDSAKYWDEHYDIDTVDRLLIPIDVDVAFKTHEDVKDFIEKLSEDCHSITEIEKHENYVIKNGINKHIKYEVKYIIGGSLTIKGVGISINVDICISDLEPPFENVDMITNILVEDKSGIRISNNIKNEIYGFSHINSFSKKKLENRIINMITKKETEIVRTDEIRSVKSNMIKRISKMVERGWTFTNINWMKLEISEDFTCTVCMEKTCPKTSIVVNTGSHFHRKCFKEYIDNIEVETDEENNFGIKCPLRGFLRF